MEVIRVSIVPPCGTVDVDFMDGTCISLIGDTVFMQNVYSGKHAEFSAHNAPVSAIGYIGSASNYVPDLISMFSELF